jgi:hypothetical protein
MARVLTTLTGFAPAGEAQVADTMFSSWKAHVGGKGAVEFSRLGLEMKQAVAERGPVDPWLGSGQGGQEGVNGMGGCRQWCFPPADLAGKPRCGRARQVDTTRAATPLE